MKGLSSLERIVLECISQKSMSYPHVLYQTGLHENVCFNILQALVIRGLAIMEGSNYQASPNLSPLLLNEINGAEAKEAESLELIEAVIEEKSNRVFRFKKVAMDSQDEKIFLAMLSNLDSFLSDAHKKSESQVPLKNRKVIFWGMGNVQNLMTQIVTGN